MEEEDDLNNAESDTPQPNTLDESQLQNELPPYPLPPSGPNSRKSMPRDELLARRRARNRVAGGYCRYLAPYEVYLPSG